MTSEQIIKFLKIIQDAQQNFQPPGLVSRICTAGVPATQDHLTLFWISHSISQLVPHNNIHSTFNSHHFLAHGSHTHPSRMDWSIVLLSTLIPIPEGKIRSFSPSALPHQSVRPTLRAPQSHVQLVVYICLSEWNASSFRIGTLILVSASLASLGHRRLTDVLRITLQWTVICLELYQATSTHRLLPTSGLLAV